MRILFYNWVDYLDDEKRGGGVSVYQRNLIRELDADPETECYFLCSGISYDVLSDAPRWERIKHGPSENRERRFEIVNSGVLSPAHHAFGDERQLDEPATEEIFYDFLRKHGPFDVVHFNNIEGLPATVLQLRDHFPDTKVIFALHNYFPVCPQVNLWFQEKENCTDYDKGRKCEVCLPHRHDQRVVRLANSVAYNLKKRGIRPGTRTFDRAFMPGMRMAGRALRFYGRRFGKSGPKLADPNAGKLLQRVEMGHHKYVRHREKMVEAINKNCDRVLCVSDRVGVVAAKFGVDPALLTTSYIGTLHAEKFAETRARDTILKADGTLTIAYLGYMRRDKGFFFLLDALEALPDEMAERINLVIASRMIDQATAERIARLSDQFRSVLHADGYSHDNLDELLSEVDLGVIPVLWEDNLPQVAIEMHARHIPLLTSDLGGAQELGNCSDFVFTAGDRRDFQRKINHILDGVTDPADYWRSAMAPKSMAEHVAELREIYTDGVTPAQGTDPEDQDLKAG
ncbi:glycosyltransferase [Pseudooceanicola nanhaiensis]|uniref:glycosyltransferase n=1 Tax=Pseudooceanicola nanhaiensis TaxID=375761 RepID=UPI001CD52860|nr:glycosyltransferase [Pseudooceanicola nanhaiensis]MCA0922771.1 glycosyltransferase [Pseudooceanicola nanhaiensis]